ncbi:MAG: SDR family oxidoreductase [Terracidiphilus sp.]|jgi:gluconate 5-dehydrogenase
MYKNAARVECRTERIPKKRPGRTGDLDGAVVFLASESSRYVTGQTLLDDGGIPFGATKAIV